MLSYSSKNWKKKLSDVIEAKILDDIFMTYFQENKGAFREFFLDLERLDNDLICHIFVFPERIYSGAAVLPVILNKDGRRIFDDDPTVMLVDATARINALPEITSVSQIDPEVIDVKLGPDQYESFFLYVAQSIGTELRRLLIDWNGPEIRVGLHDDDEPLILTR